MRRKREKTPEQIEFERLFPGDDHDDDDDDYIPMWGTATNMYADLQDEPKKEQPTLWQKFLNFFK